MVLEGRNLKKTFGGITAIADFSIQLPKGRITGLIGPNGAGKTTAFNLLTGFLKPDLGRDPSPRQGHRRRSRTSWWRRAWRGPSRTSGSSPG